MSLISTLAPGPALSSLTTAVGLGGSQLSNILMAYGVMMVSLQATTTLSPFCSSVGLGGADSLYPWLRAQEWALISLCKAG